MHIPTIVRKPLENPSSLPNERGDVRHLELLAKLMDSAFEIPGMKVRFGLDSIIGLLPGFGDFATSFVSLYILQEAHRRGVSRLTLARMGGNILVDWLFGSVPVLGDAFDVFWKSNQKNVAILREHEANPISTRERTIGDRLFLIAIIAILIAALVGSMTISYWVITSVLGLFFHKA